MGEYSKVANELHGLEMRESIQDAEERVGRLFEDYEEIVERCGISIEPKKASKLLVNAVRPLTLRKKIKDELEFGKNGAARKDPVALYDFMVQRVIHWDYRDSSDKRNRAKKVAVKKLQTH